MPETLRRLVESEVPPVCAVVESEVYPVLSISPYITPHPIHTPHLAFNQSGKRCGPRLHPRPQVRQIYSSRSPNHKPDAECNALTLDSNRAALSAKPLRGDGHENPRLTIPRDPIGGRGGSVCHHTKRRPQRGQKRTSALSVVPLLQNIKSCAPRMELK